MKKIVGVFALLTALLGFVSCGSTYYVGTASYDKNKEENFEIPSHADGNLLLKRESKYAASAVPVFIYLDGKYIGKIGSGDYWQGNIPEGEHEIESVLPATAWSDPQLLEVYKAKRVDKLQVTISNSEKTVLWIRLQGRKATLTKMQQ